MGGNLYVYRHVRCPACTGTGFVRQALCGTCEGKGHTTQDVPFRQALVEVLGDREFLHALRVSLAALEPVGKEHSMRDRGPARRSALGPISEGQLNALEGNGLSLVWRADLETLEAWQAQARAVLQELLDSHHYCVVRFELGEIPSKGLPCGLCKQAKALLEQSLAALATP